MALRWGTPPERTKATKARQVLWHKEAGQLRSRMGSWAIIRTYPKTKEGSVAAGACASGIRNGNYKSFPKGQFESVSRNSNVWVRAIPTDTGDHA